MTSVQYMRGVMQLKMKTFYAYFKTFSCMHDLLRKKKQILVKIVVFHSVARCF